MYVCHRTCPAFPMLGWLMPALLAVFLAGAALMPMTYTLGWLAVLPGAARLARPEMVTLAWAALLLLPLRLAMRPLWRAAG